LLTFLLEQWVNVFIQGTVAKATLSEESDGRLDFSTFAVNRIFSDGIAWGGEQAHHVAEKTTRRTADQDRLMEG
jgi:hypothetical protein